MTQQILSFDSTILNTYQSCSQKMDYNFIQHLALPDKAEPLERGDLMHKMLEIYYGLIGPRNFKTEIWRDLYNAGFCAPDECARHEQVVAFATSTVPLFVSKMSLDPDVVDSTIFQFKEYANHFQHDEWQALAVEEVGTKALYEDEILKILYNFKIDLIAQKGHILAPWDHKTSSRRGTVNSLSNQFIGYAWGVGVNYVVVNKIGFQKTLKPAERFERHVLMIDDERKNEWQINTLYWAFHMAWETELISSDQFVAYLDWFKKQKLKIKNFTSCDKYSGCIYANLCEASPSGREYKAERDYKIGRSWDVASILEAKEG